MTTAVLTPAQQEALLDLAGALAERLRHVPVSFTGGGTADVGLPRNCLGKVEGLLRRARDLAEFRDTLGLLHQLDPIEAQNAQHPKNQYTVLRDELRRFMGAHPGRAVDEWLYVLGWVRRLLPPGERDNGASGSRRDTGGRDAPPPRTRAPEPPPPPPPPVRPAKTGERMWKDAILAFERGRVVARQGRDRVAEDTSNAVPVDIVTKLRKREKVVADVVVIPGLGTALRIAEVKNVRG